MGLDDVSVCTFMAVVLCLNKTIKAESQINLLAFQTFHCNTLTRTWTCVPHLYGPPQCLPCQCTGASVPRGKTVA